MSSERGVGISSVESLRFPGEGSSAQGKSGPKSRPKGVDDGQQVDIPVLSYSSMQGHRRIVDTARMVECGQAVRSDRSEVRDPLRLSRYGETIASKR